MWFNEKKNESKLRCMRAVLKNQLCNFLPFKPDFSRENEVISRFFFPYKLTSKEGKNRNHFLCVLPLLDVFDLEGVEKHDK